MAEGYEQLVYRPRSLLGERPHLMPILKVNNFVDFYRYLATSSDVHALSGRGDEVAATEFANRRILETLELAPDDALLDIGCGDGCLLRMAEGRVATRVGIVPSYEEQEELQKNVAGVTIHVAGAQTLPLESVEFSKIVCNSVLLLLESENDVCQAMKEIARVARPHARVWLGEIPAVDELTCFGKYKGNSIVGFLWHSLRRVGPRAFLSSAKEVLAALAGTHTLVLSSAAIFHASPEKFIRMAEQCGLRPASHFKHERLDRSGKIVESPYRYNYIFVK